MLQEPGNVARASYRAYVDKDRGAIEALIAPDFHFTSPLDNRLDRDAYLARCWPNSAMLAGFEFVDVAVHGEYVFVVYEAVTTAGRRFRNAERLRMRDGRIIEAEVYFGWYVPHPAPDGGFIESGR
ncbi:ketosteroid isomerase [Burkholderia sp. MSMB1072]|uniref:nuclear transport factor 2 family protein n=1 Tax=unclassified Burkholderia TaxID=2613784 RepID=UPI00075B2768|nr:MULTISPECIES: nuclear transport factor 2 family protein [unclassified Burkholderia]KVD37244.1 ketosteroid isomerase [Burkholderia sp. ABCPW 11]KVH63573.1 ketosteroid isomerase [Burkholderia sp. MSMB1072]KVT05417.1 ketosteroid isomerase [Burkholderia sp. MSMB1078WGS]KWO45875.1 ketosteroid isomerase [Burkholderia sp. MSMB1459WGS]